MGRIDDERPGEPAAAGAPTPGPNGKTAANTRPKLGDRKVSHGTAVSLDLQVILRRDGSRRDEHDSGHVTTLMHWMRAQQLALSHSVSEHVNRSTAQASGVLERLSRGAAALQLEQAAQLRRVGDWLQAQSDEAAQSWHRTVVRLNALASRHDQSSVLLTFLVLRALNDDEPNCEDAVAYLQALQAHDPDAVVEMMPQLADSLMYFHERHGGVIPPHALARAHRAVSSASAAHDDDDDGDDGTLRRSPAGAGDGRGQVTAAGGGGGGTVPSPAPVDAAGAAGAAGAGAAATCAAAVVAHADADVASIAAVGVGGGGEVSAPYPHALEAWLLTQCNRSRHFKLRWLWCLQSTGGAAAEPLIASVQSLSIFQCGLPEQNFIDALLELSRRLVGVPREHRQAMLQRALGAVNEQLADTLWVPTCALAARHHRVVRMLPNESIVLSTKARVPYLLICETLPVDESWDAAPGSLTELGRQVSSTPPTAATSGAPGGGGGALAGGGGLGGAHAAPAGLAAPATAQGGARPPFANAIAPVAGAGAGSDADGVAAGGADAEASRAHGSGGYGDGYGGGYGGYGGSLYAGLDWSAEAVAGGGGGVAAAASLSASLGGPLSPRGWRPVRAGAGAAGADGADGGAGGDSAGLVRSNTLTKLIQAQLPSAWWGAASTPRAPSATAAKVKVDDIVAPSKPPAVGGAAATAGPAPVAAAAAIAIGERGGAAGEPAWRGGGGGGGAAAPRTPPPTPILGIVHTTRPAGTPPAVPTGGSSGAILAHDDLDASFAVTCAPHVTPTAAGTAAAAAAVAGPAVGVTSEGSDASRAANRLRIFGEGWAEREKRVAAMSPYGNLRGWSLLPVIVKANDDLRQEQFAVQLIGVIQKCYDDAGLPLQLRTCTIVATAHDGGLVQVVTGAISLDSVKKRLGGGTLSDVFRLVYGPPSSKTHQRALTLFTESCAAWAVVAFLLQIKDRHNGNILLHADGYIVHIDFGFLISNSPGGNIGFESAPFKLTHEYVELMGGVKSANFRRFRNLFVQGYLAARRRDAKILQLLEMTRTGVGRYLPCFMGGEAAVEAMRQRFKPSLTRREAAHYAATLVESAIGHWRTTCYDSYQRCVQGIRA